MSPSLDFVHGAVLVSALFHAAWSASIKGSPDNPLSAVGITGVAMLLVAS